MRHMNSPLSDMITRPVSLYSDDFVQERMRTVAQTLKTAHDSVDASQRTQKKHYDTRHHAKMTILKPGDQVRVRNVRFRPGVSRKMHDPWSSVCIVVGTVGKRHVDLLDPSTGITRRTHLKFVKPAVQRSANGVECL